MSIASKRMNREWSDLFYYDESIHEKLRWKFAGNYGKQELGKPFSKDEPVRFHIDSDGYMIVTLASWPVKIHKIVYELHNPGSIGIVDHIDLCKTNNSIGNLRLVTEDINSRNSKQFSTNTSGVTGVCYRGGKYPSWRATWVDPKTGRRMDKGFGIKTFGFDLAFSLACEFRKLKIEELNAQGAGYTDLHGSKGET